MAFEIEKDIPVSPRKKKGYRSKYPFKSMGIGDSFFVPVASSPRGGMSSLCGACRNGSERLFGGSGHFSVRTVEGGYRVWRVK